MSQIANSQSSTGTIERPKQRNEDKPKSFRCGHLNHPAMPGYTPQGALLLDMDTFSPESPETPPLPPAPVFSPPKNTVLGLLWSDHISDAMTAEQQCLMDNGYLWVRKISDTLQGEIFEATSLDGNESVVIKKTLKTLHKKRISREVDGVNYVVDEDIIKEAILLHHLTVDNTPPCNYMVRFIKIFENEEAFFLVMEHAGHVNLEQFAKRAHELIAAKRLKHSEWRQFLKYILWQIVVLVHWLHEDMHCCHLDLNLRNVMILNGDFIENEDGTVSISPNLEIKLTDFGLAELFQTDRVNVQNSDDAMFDDDEKVYNDNAFRCNKRSVPDKTVLAPPRVFHELVYDARKADMWSVGVMLYQLATGCDPYQNASDHDANFQRIKHCKFSEILRLQKRSKFVNAKMIKLMVGLLNVDEAQRMSTTDLLQNKWFTLYYNKYKAQIKKKSEAQMKRNKRLSVKDSMIPYYQCTDY